MSTTTPADAPLPALRCPLCGGPNGCAPAACGSFQAACWCREAVFSKALLKQVPPDQRGLACICQRCASSAASTVEGGVDGMQEGTARAACITGAAGPSS